MNLPAQQNPFIGRVRELRSAAELLSGHRLLTLVGTGGSGKTRIALKLAAEASDQFSDGVFWVPLASVRDANLVEPAIARSVGAGDDLREHLADRSLLLVLDNVEQVVAAAPLLASLLATCPALHMLATSREPLRIKAEQRFTVHPLIAADAVALFVERARAVDSAFIEEEVVEAICRRVDYLPLAVELAATRVNALTPTALLARLERRLPLLTGGTRDMPERHQTLRATLEWSEDLLPAMECQLFHHLAIFEGDFDLSAAEGVCGADLAGISSLVDKCLVRRASEGRFALLETIREFADDRLTANERDQLGRRHSEYFVAVAEAAGASTQSWPPNPEAFGTLDADLANLRAALKRTRSKGGSELILRLGTALSRYWIDRAHHQDACSWLKTAPLQDVSVTASVRAAALEAAGMLDFFVADDSDQAERYYRQALELHRALGNGERVAYLLNRLGRIARERGDFQTALSLHRQALGLFEEMADNAGRAASLHLLGETERDHGRAEDAEPLLADAIRLARTSYPSLLPHSVHSLGDAALDRGDYTRATAHYEESLKLTGINERRSRVLCVAGIGSALAGMGEYSRAARIWGAVEAEERTLGFRILPDERQRYEHWAETAREGLGETAFLAACAEGAALPFHQALTQPAASPPSSLGSHQRRPTAYGRASDEDGTFRRDGEYWTIAYEGRVLRLRDSKGIRVLAHLVADAGRPHAAVDLERLGAQGAEVTALALASGDAGELLDNEARRAYRARLAELRVAIDEATACHKADAAGLLREEMDFLTHELSRALGLGGRSRRAGSIAERARLNVMRAVRAAMQRISLADAELGAHLEATIRTGTVCVYRPDPRLPLAWRVTIGDVRAG